MNNWLCLQTYAGQELNLVTALNQLQIPAYTPCSQRKVKRFFTEVVEGCAYFKTYLFASLDYHERKSGVQLLPVKMKSRVVGELPSDFIEAMREREVNGYIVTAPVRPFKQGDPLIIQEGLGRGYEAIFDSYLGDDERCIILATMFNQTMRMPVNLSDLALAV